VMWAYASRNGVIDISIFAQGMVSNFCTNVPFYIPYQCSFHGVIQYSLSKRSGDPDPRGRSIA